MAVNINIPSQVSQTITDGVTDKAPSEDAVHDALALKANSADLGATAFSNDYNDLDNLPSIPAAQVNSDWNAVSGVAEILNKPTIPTSLPPSGVAGGDLNGNYPNPTVDGIHGIDMQSGTPTSGDVWVYGGSPAKWQHQMLHASQVDNDSAVTGTHVSDALNHLDTTKEPSITAGTTAQYWRGDKSWQTLNKSAVGLGNVDNTSDLNKPISTATQTALNAKQDSLVSGTNIKTINGNSILGSGDITVGGGITVGTTAVTSGTDTRVFFQQGGVVQQDANFTFNNTQKRLTLRASGTAATDIPFVVRNSADNRNFLTVNGAGDVFNNGAGGVTDNTFFGENVGRNTTGQYNTFFGKECGRSNTSGTQNDFFGFNAGLNNTSGFFNSFFGTNSGSLNTTGQQNAFFGHTSGQNSTGSYNSFFGYGAGKPTTAFYNSFFGNNSGASNTTGAENVFVGFSAGSANSTASFNTFVGTNSAVFQTSGTNNTYLGHNSGRFYSGGVNLTISNNSVFIGKDTKALANNQTNQIVIGFDAIGLGSNTTVIGNSSTTLFRPYGNVAIGADTAGARLDVRAQGALSTDIAFRVRNSADSVTLQQFNGDGSWIHRNNANTWYEYFDGSSKIEYRRTGIFELGTNNDVTEFRFTCNTGNVYFRGGSNLLNIINNNNFHFEESTGILPTSGAGAIVMKNRTAPSTNVQDRFYLYSADIVAGNAAPHFRTENGSIIKLYQETTAVASSTLVGGGGTTLTDTDTFDGYTLKQIIKALRNQGILA